MIDADQLAFGATFLKMRNVFNLRGDKADVRQAMEAYFRVLRPFPLRSVDAGAEVWLTRGTHFPKPAEWLGSIPRLKGASLLVMPEDDAREYRQAVEKHYEDDPCGCHECHEAGVTHRMLRYVPDTDSDDQDVRMVMDGKVVVRGHWAHGHELARWYAARDAYMGLRVKYHGRLIKRIPKVSQAAIDAEER